MNSAKGKTVLVELKNGHSITGTLMAFDVHINIHLENADERDNSTVVRKIGSVFVRGDTIILISPAL